MLCRSGMEKSGKNQQGGQKISVSGRWTKWAMDDTGNLLTHLFADASLSGGPLHVPGEGGEDGGAHTVIAPRARLGCEPAKNGWFQYDLTPCGLPDMGVRHPASTMPEASVFEHFFLSHRIGRSCEFGGSRLARKMCCKKRRIFRRCVGKCDRRREKAPCQQGVAPKGGVPRFDSFLSLGTPPLLALGLTRKTFLTLLRCRSRP